MEKEAPKMSVGMGSRGARGNDGVGAREREETKEMAVKEKKKEEVGSYVLMRVDEWG